MIFKLSLCVPSSSGGWFQSPAAGGLSAALLHRDAARGSMRRCARRRRQDAGLSLAGPWSVATLGAASMA